MTRVPRTRSILVAAVLLALLVAPIAGARTLSSQSAAHPADGGWSGAIQHWVGALLGLSHPNHHRRSGTKVPSAKEATGGSCIDPGGRCL